MSFTTDIVCFYGEFEKIILEIIIKYYSLTSPEYRNNPKYWDRQAFANSVDPDQML